MKTKKLKVWNGRGCGFMAGSPMEKGRKVEVDPRYKFQCRHINVCAASRADAVRLINDAAGYRAVTINELTNYFADCWGNKMKDVTQERGVWVSYTGASDEVPTKVL